MKKATGLGADRRGNLDPKSPEQKLTQRVSRAVSRIDDSRIQSEYSQVEYVRILTHKRRDSTDRLKSPRSTQQGQYSGKGCLESSAKPLVKADKKLKHKGKDKNECLEVFRQPTCNIQEMMIRQQQRSLVAQREEKQQAKLRRMIELGQKEHKTLMSVFSRKVRQLNQELERSKSKSKSKSRSKSRSRSKSHLGSLSKAIPSKGMGKSHTRLNISQSASSPTGHSLDSQPEEKQIFHNHTLRKICSSLQALRRRLNTSQQRPTDVLPVYIPKKHRPPRCRSVRIGTENRQFSRHSISTRTESQLLRNGSSVLRTLRHFNRIISKRLLIGFLSLRHCRPCQVHSVGVNTEPDLRKGEEVPKTGNQLKSSQRSRQREKKKLLEKKYKLLLEARECQQLELDFAYDKERGIPTNLHVVNQYTMCLNRYLLMYYDQQLLEEMQKNYGAGWAQRVRVFNGYDMGDVEPYIVSEDLFEQFQTSVIESSEQNTDAQVREYDHIHNKSIFDCFNEALNTRRRYYEIDGQPFPWSMPLRTSSRTQHTLTKTELQATLQIVKNYILACCRTLAGTYIEQTTSQPCTLLAVGYQEYLQLPLHHNPHVDRVKSHRIQQVVNSMMANQNPRWNWHQNERSELLFMVCEEIFDDLCSQIGKLLVFLNIKHAY